MLPVLPFLLGATVERRLRAVARHAVLLQRAFGVLVLAGAAALWFQVDTQLAARVPSLFPTL